MINNFENNGILNNKIINFKVEKLIREANDFFIHSMNYEKALYKINEVLVLEPKKIKALILKGEILFCMDKEKESLEYFDKAINADPYCSEAYGSKAGALDVLDKQHEALDCCQKAFDNLNDKDSYLLPSLYDQKIAILLRLKKYNEARKVLKNCKTSLSSEDSSYLVSCYGDLIELSCKEKQKKHEMVKKIQLKVVN